MIKIILGLNKKNHINMEQVRKKIKMMSVNQLSIYHTLIEAYNIIRNAASDQIKTKWTEKCENEYFLRSEDRNDLFVPRKPRLKCRGFTYFGAKLFNKLPKNIRENNNPNTFKSLIKDWIWQNIVSF